MSHFNMTGDLVINRLTELRHLSNIYKNKIISYLDFNESWKELMYIIPKNLNTDSCRTSNAIINSNDVSKYNINDMHAIERAMHSLINRSCAEIFFDEWSTSGRKDQRPNLGVLLHLLIKADLFGAADYIARELLKESPPPRPFDGPGAYIDISSAELNAMNSIGIIEETQDIVEEEELRHHMEDNATRALNDHAETNEIRILPNGDRTNRNEMAIEVQSNCGINLSHVSLPNDGLPNLTIFRKI